MSEKLLIDAHYEDETRVAIVNEKGELEHFESEHKNTQRIKGNIYLAKVIRIEPSIQAAFVDYGDEKHGFLPFSEIKPEYYNKAVVESEDTENDSEKKQYKIQELITHKQVLLVQAIKEVRGNKCAAFTTYISLPGRYCVLLSSSNGKQGGISKKINATDKERLRGILDSLDIPEGLSLIIRTAGENKKKPEIKRDFDYLMRLWGEITQKVMNSVAPLLICEDGDIVKRAIRDLYSKEIEEILIEGSTAYKEARTFMKLYTPSHVKKIKPYEDTDLPIFQKYKVEEKVEKIMDTTVILPSGGSIVINQTEALTAIDVNSGRTKQDRDIDETALRTNLEAATEIARQMKLRDIGGIVVIDFIDMNDQAYISKVEKKFKDETNSDYSNLQIYKISPLGLMELSRQRMRPSISDMNFVSCPNCQGTGKVLACDSIALAIIRKIENFIIKENAIVIEVSVPENTYGFLLNKKRKTLSDMEEKFECYIELISSPDISGFDCKLKVKEARPNLKKNFGFIPKQNSETIKENTKNPQDKISEQENKKKIKKTKNKKRLDENKQLETRAAPNPKQQEKIENIPTTKISQKDNKQDIVEKTPETLNTKENPQVQKNKPKRRRKKRTKPTEQKDVMIFMEPKEIKKDTYKEPSEDLSQDIHKNTTVNWLKKIFNS